MGFVGEYEVVSAGEGGSLATAVNGRLEQGWRLLGRPFGAAGRIHQALVRGRALADEERMRRLSDDEDR